jgi:WD40 repeat protein
VTSCILSIQFFNCANGEQTEKFQSKSFVEPAKIYTLSSAHTEAATSIIFSEDMKMFATGGFDSTVRIWELPNGTDSGPNLKAELSGHRPYPLQLKFVDKGSALAILDADSCKFSCYDIKRSKETCVSTKHERMIWSLDKRADSQVFATAGSSDLTVRLLDVKGKEPFEIRAIKVEGESAEYAVFSPDGSTLAISSGNESVEIWKIKEHDLVCQRKLRLDSSRTDSLTWMPDGKTLAQSELVLRKGQKCAACDLRITLWDVTTGKKVNSNIFRGQESRLRAWSISNDGKKVVTADSEGFITLWDLGKGDKLQCCQITSPATAVAAGSNGNMVGTANDDGSICIIRFSPVNGR